MSVLKVTALFNVQAQPDCSDFSTEEKAPFSVWLNRTTKGRSQCLIFGDRELRQYDKTRNTTVRDYQEAMRYLPRKLVPCS